jgi:hypothetical protein
MRDDTYWPRSFMDDDPAPDPVSLINEPIRDEVIELRPGQAAASLYALLGGVRNQAQALLDRMETRGCVCAEGGAERGVCYPQPSAK